jgi:hypothetical protein
MTKVRRKAMGSYLKNGRKPKRDAQGQRPRLHSEGNSSTRSRASVGSEEGDDHARSASHALRILGGGKRKVTRQPSSSLPSPASAASNHEHRVSNPDTQISRIAPTLDLVLSSAPIVQPMRVGVPLPFNGTSPQPFKSIGKPLDPFRTMFQAHHPRVSVEELKFHCMCARGFMCILAILTSPRFSCLRYQSNGPALDTNTGQVAQRLSEYPVYSFSAL